MVTLFFSGWHGPWHLGPIWFLLKLLAVLFVFIWLRTTLPRLRYDQLMQLRVEGSPAGRDDQRGGDGPLGGGV